MRAAERHRESKHRASPTRSANGVFQGILAETGVAAAIGGHAPDPRYVSVALTLPPC